MLIIFSSLSDIGALLRRIPGRELLSLQDAVLFVSTPRTIEAEYPYGEIIESAPATSEEDTPPPPPSKKRQLNDSDNDEPKGIKNFAKYSECILTDLVIPELNLKQKLSLPKNMRNKNWRKNYDILTSLAVSSSSWKSRLSSFHKLQQFAKNTNTKISWPLKQKFINGFIVWAFHNKDISAKTTQTYISHLSSIQKLLGFKKIDTKKYNTKTLLKGFQNGEKLIGEKKENRETIDFSTLHKIKKKIFCSNKSKILKKSIWAACTTAFFGCFRMGELLPKLEFKIDTNFDLLWDDIKLNKKHASIALKSQKNNILNKQTIHIFKFKDKVTCPIKALLKLKKEAQKNGCFKKQNPVFSINNSKNLTQRKLNVFLQESFPNRKFSGHSFRSGVPSSLADFPNIANDWHVMGWGRWRSTMFLKYQKRTKKQSKWIFKKIEKALL